MSLEGYQPQLITDDESFPKLKGKYVAEVDSCMRQQGTSVKTGEPYDFYGMKFVVLETIEGDKGEKRRLDKTFQNTEEGLKKLADSLFTAGLECDVSEAKIDETIAKSIGKRVNISAWVWKEKDVQMVKVVNEFKLKKGKKASGEAPAF